MTVEESNVKTIEEYEEILNAYLNKKFNIVQLDTTQINDKFDIFNIFFTSLKFPSYFGNNWDALWDCLKDLSWLEIKDTVLLIKLKVGSKNKEIETLLGILKHAKEFWSKYNVPFDVILFEGGEK